MNISVQQLLAKIEKELREAKDSSTTARLRERVHAMKSLCELILDEPAFVKEEVPVIQAHSPRPVQLAPTSGGQQAKRMDIDDQANGDSLFDF